MIPAGIQHNAHMYYILVRSLQERSSLIEYLKNKGITAVFHYVPLHLSPFGSKFRNPVMKMDVSELAGARLLRLPLYADITKEEQDCVIDNVVSFFNGR